MEGFPCGWWAHTKRMTGTQSKRKEIDSKGKITRNGQRNQTLNNGK